MKLRNKILLGFSGVLAAILIVGSMIGVSLSTMNRISRGVETVDGALTDALVAQGGMLRFLLYKDLAFVPRAQDSLRAAIDKFGRAGNYLTRPENKASAKQQIEDLQFISQTLQGMVELEKKRLQTEEALRPVTASLENLMMELRQQADAMLAADFSPELLKRQEMVVDAFNMFMKARLAARVYTMTATPDNERSAMTGLKVMFDAINSLDGLFTQAAAASVIKNVTSEARKYEDLFRQLVTVTGQIQQETIKIRDRFAGILTGSLKITSSATEALILTGASSQNMLYIAAAVVFLSLLGIAIMLTRNVQAQLGKDPGELAIIAGRVTKGELDIDDGSPRIGVYGNMVGMVAALKENIHNAQLESEKAHQESVRAQQAMQSAENASLEAQGKTKAMMIAADKLEGVAQIVSSASAQLSSQIEHSERGAAEQASRVTETATAMEEMNSTVLEVAKNAGQAADVSTSTREKAMAGAGVVERAVKSIRSVQQQSLALKKDMELLGASAQSIDQIMRVISDIADQTNLLALNAAIEAARAGDAGRGFAVVADEVRKLAEKTMASTTDVGNAIRAIQQSAAKSMEQVDQAVTTIEEATELANQSGIVLQEIVSMVDHTADQVRAIATASEQQSATSDEINQSIYKVNNIAGETARAMSEATHAVADLAHQAQILTTLIDDMKRG